MYGLTFIAGLIYVQSCFSKVRLYAVRLIAKYSDRRRHDSRRKRLARGYIIATRVIKHSDAGSAFSSMFTVAPNCAWLDETRGSVKDMDYTYGITDHAGDWCQFTLHISRTRTLSPTLSRPM